MCTAITYQPRELYMGRSLDYEASYGEEIVMLPRRFPLRFRHGGGRGVGQMDVDPGAVFAGVMSEDQVGFEKRRIKFLQLGGQKRAQFAQRAGLILHRGLRVWQPVRP